VNALAFRTTRNPNHHLYRNGNLFWIHYTVHTPDYQKKRVRQSLATSDLKLAQQRRNQIFRELQQEALGQAA